MTEAELAAALRERFARLRKEFPELVEMTRQVSDERFLQAHARCSACKKFHVTVRDFVAVAEQSKDLDECLAALQALCVKRFPARCLKKIDQIEGKIKAGRQ